MKDIYTALPGIVEEFDPETRRAKVRGAIQIALPDGSYLPRTPIVNVPTIFQCGGGWTIYFPVQPGEMVLLLYSMRGITEFKNTFEESPPTMSSLLSERDVMLIPGFGSLEFTPADEEGFSIQDEDGENYILMKEDDITLEAKGEITINAEGDVSIDSDGSVSINAGSSVDITAPSINFNGTVTGDNP